MHRIRGDPDLAPLVCPCSGWGERVAKPASLGDCEAKWPLISLGKFFRLPLATNIRWAPPSCR